MLSLVAATIGLVFVVLYPAVPWGRLFSVDPGIGAAEAGPATLIVLVVFALGLPASTVTQVRLARQEGYAVFIAAALGSVLALLLVVLAVQANAGLPVVVAGLTAPLLLMVVANGWLLFRRQAPELRPAAKLANLHDAAGLLRAGFLFFVIGVAATVAFASDTMILTQLIGPEAVAEYGVAYRLFMIPTVLVSAFLIPLWPAYGDAAARGDVPWIRRTLWRSLVLGLAITAAIAGVLVVLGETIIDVWVGQVVPTSPELLLGFGIWTVMSAGGVAVAMFLNGTNEIRLQAFLAVIMSIANIALSIWLTLQIGVAGVVWGTVIAYGGLVLLPMLVYVPSVLSRVSYSGTATRGRCPRPR
jgi:O-antigen/teichoic acid export membrane protein